MTRTSLRLPLPVTLAALALGALVPAAAGAATPVRCEIYIDDTDTDRNVPMECTRPDGSTFVNVPDGRYLHVTDVLLRPRLGTQTDVAASVRIWEERGGDPTGCSDDASGVLGSFVTDQYLQLPDTSQQGQLHVSYRVPFLVLTPKDCLAVFTSTSQGAVVEVSGLLATSSDFGLIRLEEPAAPAMACAPLLLLLAAVGRARRAA